MSTRLARLLGRNDIQFDVAIRELEAATGHQAIDARLLGEITATAHTTIRTLGLDSKDITALELYNSLRAQKDKTVFNATDYVGIMINGDCLSLSRGDLALDKLHKLSFAKRSVTGMRHALVEELERRYRQANRQGVRKLEPMFAVIRGRSTHS